MLCLSSLKMEEIYTPRPLPVTFTHYWFLESHYCCMRVTLSQDCVSSKLST